MIKIKGFQGWRWLVKIFHAIFILFIPFLKINGESALRFDVPELKLYFFGKTLWMNEFFIVFIATIFLTVFVVFMTVIFGRIWCGWFCPQTVINDFTVFIDRIKDRGYLIKLLSYTVLLILSVVIGANLIWYFVSPYDFFEGLFRGALGKTTIGFWIVLTLIIFLNFAFIRRRFCSTICPYARLQSVLFDNSTLLIAFDKSRIDECMDCKACVKVCPTGIDIRKGENIACINCAECVDVCSDIFKKRNKKGLINYSFGKPGEKFKILRQNSIITGLLLFISLIFLLYVTLSRTMIDISIVSEYNQVIKRNENESINIFLVSIENRQSIDDIIEIKPEDGKLVVIPERFEIKAGELKRIRILLRGKIDKDTVTLNFVSHSDNRVYKKDVIITMP